MISRLFCLCIISLILLPTSMLAEAPPSPTPPPGCSGKLIDLTDPEVAKELPNLSVISSGPTTVEYHTSNQTTDKVSIKEFVTEDELGNIIIVGTKCTLSCTGSSCSQRGCEPTRFGACSSWSCGLLCVGTCTTHTSIEQ